MSKNIKTAVAVIAMAAGVGLAGFCIWADLTEPTEVCHPMAGCYTSPALIDRRPAPPPIETPS